MGIAVAIDDDVLNAARIIAERDRKPVGEVVSELARKTLDRTPTFEERRNGVPLLTPKSGRQVTTEVVNELRDELE